LFGAISQVDHFHGTIDVFISARCRAPTRKGIGRIIRLKKISLRRAEKEREKKEGEKKEAEKYLR